TTTIEVNRGVVTNGDQVLALFPAAAKFKVSQAKYNLLTLERDTWSLHQSPWDDIRSPDAHLQAPPGIDAAFASGRASFLFRPLRFRLPAERARTYHVVRGLIVPPTFLADGPDPAKFLLRFSVNGASTTVNMADFMPGKPYLHDFVVQASGPEIQVKSET